MNVGELKKIIKDMPDKTIVVLSSDSEGNSYSECQDWSSDHKYKIEYAFPQPGIQGTLGMTLLDYFAAKAMLGDWAAQDGSDDGTGTFSPGTSDATLIAQAQLYYRMADAMLSARTALASEGGSK